MNYNLVGNRFSPTEEEIISYFLERKMNGLGFPVHVINTLNIRDFEPWELPERAAIRDDDVWYFFSEVNKKPANSNKTERTTKAGSWRVTGNDKQIFNEHRNNIIGVEKYLVFYQGRGRKATKTNWVIHEYHSAKASAYQKPYILCCLSQKSGESSGRAAADS